MNDERIKDAIRDAKPPLFPTVDEVYDNLQKRSEANVNHTPRQQGPYIVCASCPHKHTLSWIGTGKRMVGIDEKGEPIIETIDAFAS